MSGLSLQILLFSVAQKKTPEVSFESSHSFTVRIVYIHCLNLCYRPNTVTVHLVAFHPSPKLTDSFTIHLFLLQLPVNSVPQTSVEIKLVFLFKNLPPLSTYLPIGYSQNLAVVTSLALSSPVPTHSSHAGYWWVVKPTLTSCSLPSHIPAPDKICLDSDSHRSTLLKSLLWSRQWPNDWTSHPMQKLHVFPHQNPL